MALVHDTATRFPAGAETVLDLTAGDRTFTHAGAAGALAAVVIYFNNTSADGITGVLYGGTAMTRRTGAVDTSEPNSVSIWTLSNLQGLGLAGSQTVTCQGATTVGHVALANTIVGTAGETDAIYDNSGFVNTTTSANPTVSFTTVAGALVYGGVAGGAASAAASYVAGTNVTTTGLTGVDWGARAAMPARSTNPTAGGSFTFSFTAASDDWSIAAASMKPVAGGGGGGTPTQMSMVI
jgi:hypothetical protein